MAFACTVMSASKASEATISLGGREGWREGGMEGGREGWREGGRDGGRGELTMIMVWVWLAIPLTQ